MADQIANYLRVAYTDLVMNQADISGSILMSDCTVKDNVDGTKTSFGYMGTFNLVPKPSRHAPTPDGDLLHRLYWATLAPFHNNIMLDETDDKAAFTSPKSEYVQKGSGAIGRAWDTMIASAAIADTAYGVAGASTEDWSAYTDRNAHSHVVAAAGGVPNLSDVLKMRRIFQECDVTGPLFAWVSPQYMEAFLLITEVKSSDFNEGKVLVEGSLGYFAGFNWKVTNSLPKTGTTRSCIFGCPGVVGLAKSINKKVRIDERTDLSYAWQVYFEICGGGARRDPERVIEHSFTEV